MLARTTSILRCAVDHADRRSPATLIVGIGAAGNQQLGVLVLIVVNSIHIPLLLMLGLGWLTHHPFGIVGAGVSSLLSETIGALFAIAYVARRAGVSRLARALDFVAAGGPVRAARISRNGLFDRRHRARRVHRRDAGAARARSVVAAFRALNVVSDLTFVVPSPVAERGPDRHRTAARCGRSARRSLVSGTGHARLAAGDDVDRRGHGGAGVAVGLRLYAQRRGRDDCGAAAGPAHDHAAPQRVGDGRAWRRSARRATRAFR